MPYPVKPEIQTSYVAHEQQQGNGWLPGQEMDVDYANLKFSIDDVIDFLKIIARSDGKLTNRSVGLDQLAYNMLLGVNEITYLPNSFIVPEDYSGTREEQLTQAFAAGIATNRPVRLDGVYEISSPISVDISGAQRLHVSGSGRIHATAEIGDVVKFTCAHGTPVAVTLIENVLNTWPGGDSQDNSTAITAPGHNYVIGDWIKLVSEDQLSGSTGTVRKRGEFAYVAEVSGDILRVVTIQDNYATSPRVVKVNTAARLIWDGPTFSSVPGMDWKNFGLTVRGFFQPFIRTGAVDGSVAVTLQSCVQAEVYFHGKTLRNRVDSLTVPGYGVQDCGSHQSNVHVHVSDTRHSYTSITNTANALDDAWKYGRTRGSRVTGLVTAASSAAFDTHTEGSEISFIGARSTAAYLGESSPACGFQLRGLRNRLIDCSDFGSRTGAQFYAQVENGCIDCEFHDFTYDGPGTAIRIGSPTSFPVKRAQIYGGVLRSPGNRSIWVANASDFLIKDVVLRPKSSDDGPCGILFESGVTGVIRNLTIDLIDFVGTDYRPFRAADDATGINVEIDGCTVINGSIQTWFDGNFTEPGAGNLVMRGLRGPNPTISGSTRHANTALFTVSDRDGWFLVSTWDQAVDGSATQVIFPEVNYDEIMIEVEGVALANSGTRDLQIAHGANDWKAGSGHYTGLSANGVKLDLTQIPLHATASGGARHAVAIIRGALHRTNKWVTTQEGTYKIESVGIIDSLRVIGSAGGLLNGGKIHLLARG